jgi:hypothetical protein
MMHRERWSLRITALWLVAMAVLLSAWGWLRDAADLARIPHFLLRLALWFGSAVFSDPVLEVRIQITRCALLITAGALAAIALLHRDRIAGEIRALVNMKSDPINLAIFRIVVFWQIYSICYVDYITRVASMPDGLQYPPQTAIPLAAWALWPHHWVAPHFIHLGLVAMQWASIAGIIGLFSRTSAAVTAFLFLLAWGRVQWYGKVDHHHHLLWFVLLLMFSPCGDAWSLDAIWAALRRAARGVTAPPGPSRRYGTPLSFCMLLFGVIYFFPGLWKICRSGLDWALSDSPKFMMQTEWRFYGDWSPIMRFDLHPAMYHLGALATMLFELSFIFLLLFRRTRPWAAVLGFGFHWMTYFTLNISFETLRNCYVLFIDWGSLFRWMGRKLFVEELVIVYPPRSRRRVALLRAFDVFGRIQWTEGLSSAGIIREQEVRGLGLYRLAAKRMPLLWLALPFLYLPFQAERPRASETGPPPEAPAYSPVSRPTFVILMGCLLLLANITAGVFRDMDGWPFACYPPFDGLSEPEYRTLQIWVTLEDGKEHMIVADDYRKSFGNRWSNLLQRILQTRDPAERNRRLSVVWKALSSQEPRFAHTKCIRFVSVRSFVDPDRRQEDPDDPQVLLETQVQMAGHL